MSLQPALCVSQRRSRCDRRQPQPRDALSGIRVIGEQRGSLDASVVWPVLVVVPSAPRHLMGPSGPLLAPSVLWLGCFPPGAGAARAGEGVEFPPWRGRAPASRSSAGVALLAPLTSDVRPSIVCRDGVSPGGCAGDVLSTSGAPVSTKCVLAGDEDTGGRPCGPATPSLSFCLPRFPRLRHLSPRARETISRRACGPVGARTALGLGASWRTGGDETWAVEVSGGRGPLHWLGTRRLCAQPTGRPALGSRSRRTCPLPRCPEEGLWGGGGGLEADLGALWHRGGFGPGSSVALRRRGSGDSRWLFILGRVARMPHAEG